jgi:hypothetical protein
MNHFVRHRVVRASTPSLLRTEIDKLLKEGWRIIGDAALATPVGLSARPYWVQTLYLAPEEIPQDSIKVDHSRAEGAADPLGEG